MGGRLTGRALVLALSTAAGAVLPLAGSPAGAKEDTREVVALAPAEAATMLAGMRTYLETIQDIVAALAENDNARIAKIAAESGAKQLHTVSPITGLKTPMGFAMMSLDTHDKFDKLADKARRGTSRTEVLADLRDIMANCMSCHATYRLGP
jgi:cytochrome c556